MRGEILFDGSPVEFASPQEAQRARHQHDLPGDQPGPLPLGHREHLPRPRAAPLRPARLERACTREATRCCARFDVDDRRAPAADELQHRHPADGGHRPRRVVRGQARDHGRAHLARSTSTRSRCCSTSSASSRRDGVSVIFVSHKLDELYAVCDRVTIMRDGRTVARRADGRDDASSSWWPPCSGRDLADGAARRAPRPSASVSTRSARDAAARPSICGVGRRVRMSSLDVRAGRDRRARRPARLRAHRDGARRLRRRPDAMAATITLRRQEPHFRRAGRRHRAPASASAPRTARSRASSPTCRCART